MDRWQAILNLNDTNGSVFGFTTSSVELDPIASDSHDVESRQRTRAHRIIDSAAFNPRQRASTPPRTPSAYPFQFQAFNNW